MFGKIALLVLYILPCLGVIVMRTIMVYDLKRFIKKEGIKFKPLPLSEKIAARISFVMSAFCPIWNLLIFFVMISQTEYILNKSFNDLKNRQILNEEE